MSGCANMVSEPRDQAWSTVRGEILARNHSGQITPLEAQLQLKRKYWEIYGGDAYMAGYFGYAVSLLTSAQRGDIELQEAQALVEAKEAEAFARASEDRRRLARLRELDGDYN
jgi:hypothetical protein